MRRIGFVAIIALTLPSHPLRAADDPAVPRLVEKLLKDKESGIRYAAAVELGRLGPRAKGAVPALIGGLNDKESAVRDAAGVALARVGEPAVEPLLETMKDKDEFTRMRAITVLGEIGPAAKLAQTPVLGASNNDASQFVRDAARKAYHRIKFEAKDLVPMLGDPEEKKRLYGVRVLGELTHDQARPALAALCKTARNDTSPEIRGDALFGLARFNRDKALNTADRNAIIAAITAVLKDPDETVRTKAAMSLGSFGTLARSALPAVQQAYRTARSPELKEALEKTDAYLRGKDPLKK